MFVAELRKKLQNPDDAAEDETSLASWMASAREDILTSDVFGALKYLPRRPYTTSVLERIAKANPHAHGFAKHVSGSSAVTGEFRFWPRYASPAGLGGSTTEPDVEYSTSRCLCFFEMKWGSGFGDHQIERQLLVGLHEAAEREFFLVLVTKRDRVPDWTRGDVHAMEEHVRSLGGQHWEELRERVRSNADRILTISWRGISSAMHRAHATMTTDPSIHEQARLLSSRIFEDVKLLLEMRDLRPYYGLANLGDGTFARPRPVFLKTSRRKGFVGLVGIFPRGPARRVTLNLRRRGRWFTGFKRLRPTPQGPLLSFRHKEMPHGG